MKIYILPIAQKLQPKTQPFKYPKHNDEYGIEQDFLNYLTKNVSLQAKSPEEAAWHYLPVYWTRWHLISGDSSEKLDELEKLVESSIFDAKKTFTICQYDDGPVVKVRNMVEFLASRKTSTGLDAPLLSKDHKLPFIKPQKKYLASFIGRPSTHPLRKEMWTRFKNIEGVNLIQDDLDERSFVNEILSSYISLCPRGYGGSSFRFFESLQLGVVPLKISDIDTRPFKAFINWDEISFYAKTIDEAAIILENSKKEDLLSMGKKAKDVYVKELSYGNWCKYVLFELLCLKKR